MNERQIGISVIILSALCTIAGAVTVYANVGGGAFGPLTGNYPACHNFNVTTKTFGAYAHGLCHWGGGSLKIYAAGGNSGAVSYHLYNVTASGNQILVGSGLTNARCLTLQQTFNALPAGNYNLSIHSGMGGGSCGNATAQLR